MQTEQDLSIVILAAGKGTRMVSTKAKVLHETFHRPMIHHVLLAIDPLGAKRVVVIVGHQEEAVRKALEPFTVIAVRQEEQLGTGHAVLMTEDVIPEQDSLVMVLCGDTPLIQTKSLTSMLKQHREKNSAVTVMTTLLEEPFGYGRIISSDNCIQCIVEEKEADETQKKIKEINAGIYIVKRSLLYEALHQLTPDNTQGEFYLTDIVEYSVSKNIEVHKYVNGKATEVLGVNSRVELEEAHNDLRLRRNVELLKQGVSLHSSLTTSVAPFSTVGVDSLLKSNVRISGESHIGKSCVLDEGVIVHDSTVGDNVHIGAYSVIENTQIAEDTELPPYSKVTG